MKRSMLILLAVLMLLLAPATQLRANAAETGTCGENLTWTLDDAGTLTISGTGAMDDYIYYAATPWYSHREAIKSVVLENGITNIGEHAFNDCENLSSITIPDSVTGIGQRAFAACESLTSITIPEGVTAIYFDTFLSCKSLSSITLPVSVTRIAEWAFAGCKNLSVVHYAGTEKQQLKISIDVYNSELENAQWHYECDGTNCPGSEPGKPTTPPAEGSFVDVAAGSYYYTPVLWAVEQGITNGLDATHFAPDATCTRAQVVTFLWRAKGCPEPKMIYNPFSDVSSSDYYYTAVLWAVENGITTGTGGNTFAPNEGCTRKQVATFLWRAQGKPASSGSNIFTDVSPDAYYYDAVLWAVENGITSGMGNGKFAPDAACTRGQIVTFLYRAMN